MAAAKKINTKSTKAEILEAYKELQEQLKAEENKDPQQEKAEKEKAEVRKEADSMSPQKIVKGLADIKLEIGGAFDTVEEALLGEFKKLEQLKKAVEYEEAHLEDAYGIKTNADSLAVLLRANQQKREDFEKEMEEKNTSFDQVMKETRQQWEKEQKERQQQLKEEEEFTKRNRKREEEEYKYNLTITRKKEEDDYNARKAALENELVQKKQTVEKDLAEREKVIAEQEIEFNELKKKVKAFPAELEKAVASAHKETEKELNTRFEYEKNLADKEMQSEVRLLKQTISSLENKIKEQESLIKQLNEKTNVAGEQVQTIALKALEGAATGRYSPERYLTEKRDEKNQKAD